MQLCSVSIHISERGCSKERSVRSNSGQPAHIRSGPCRRRGYRLPRYGHSQKFRQSRHREVSCVRVEDREVPGSVAEPTGMSRRRARRVVGTDRPQTLVRPPFATRTERGSGLCQRFSRRGLSNLPRKTTVPRENPKPVGCPRISFRVERTLVRLDFWTTRTRDGGAHAWSQTKSGHGRDSAGSCANL